MLLRRSSDEVDKGFLRTSVRGPLPNRTMYLMAEIIIVALAAGFTAHALNSYELDPWLFTPVAASLACLPVPEVIRVLRRERIRVWYNGLSCGDLFTPWLEIVGVRWSSEPEIHNGFSILHIPLWFEAHVPVTVFLRYSDMRIKLVTSVHWKDFEKLERAFVEAGVSFTQLNPEEFVGEFGIIPPASVKQVKRMIKHEGLTHTA